jgi:hypothetical protein
MDFRYTHKWKNFKILAQPQYNRMNYCIYEAHLARDSAKAVNSPSGIFPFLYCMAQNLAPDVVLAGVAEF